jgi:Ca2+-binding RTX toxin-like protein
MIMAIPAQVSALFPLLGITGRITEFTGTPDTDVLNGGDGSDYMDSLGGVDTLNGGGGNDYLNGGTGLLLLGDIITGGDGMDTAGYTGSAAGVTVTLTLNGAGVGLAGDALGDVLTSIENLVGSDFADTLTGDNLANVLIGLAGNDSLDGGGGNDTLIGGAGADTLIGRDGIDTADYSTSSQAVRVNLSRTFQNGGDAAGDGLTFIENVTGSASDDNLRGNNSNNVLTGGGGNDVLNGGNGNDTLIGGSGDDRFLIADAGNDVYIGGLGADRWSVADVGNDIYRYFSTAEIQSDFISGFNASGSKIDLSNIDARVDLIGEQSFVYGGQLTVSGPGPGEIVWQQDGTFSNRFTVFVNTDNDAIANATYQMNLTGVGAMSEGLFDL